MVEGHEDVIDKLESRVDTDTRGSAASGQTSKTTVTPEGADNPTEASLNMWAASTLPVVKAHLERAKSIQDALKNSNRNTTASR
jgi:hypothetical protein